jgi:hypothetical protein
MQHIIQYQLFDVGFSNAGKSYELQNKISDIFNKQLKAGMEQLFDRLVPDGDIILSLDEVDIDLGNITYDLLARDLAGKVLLELEKEIKYRLSLRQNTSSETPGGDGPQFKSLKAGYADLLEYFLLTGAMPWWASGEWMADPVTLIEYLLAEDTAGLKRLIIRAGQQDYVRRRLVYQFSDQVIHDLINLLEPAQATFIFDYHAAVVKVHQQGELIESATNKVFDKTLWVFILTYILVDRGSLFNQKSFVRSTLAGIAHHHNRNYADLLILLTAALNSDQLLSRQSSYLPVIIEELFLEETDDRYLANDRRADNEAAGLQQDIELIKHYLVFGSLPWWARPYSTGNIVDLFLDLIRTVPKALSDIIRALGQNEEVRKQIATVFDDEVTKKIIKLLEPENYLFIINYAAQVQQLHVKKVVVHTDIKDFKKAVWKFIIDFLLAERGSEFNERMFLESNIRRLAANYNIQYGDMLRCFVQSIGQQHQDSVGHMPLFKLLAGLLKDKDWQSLEHSSQEASKHRVSELQRSSLNETRQVVVLKDVLLHWLIYGNLPWWGKEYFEWTGAKMIETLLSKAPAEAALLLKFSGSESNARHRIIHQIPLQLVIAVFKLYPQGPEAARLYEYFSAAASAQIKSDDQLDYARAGKNILLVLWDVFIDGQYRSFDPGAFIQGAILYLTEHYPIKVPQILDALKKEFGTADREVYQKILDQVSPPVAAINLEQAPLDGDTGTIAVNGVISDPLTDEDPGDSQAVVNEAFRILEYFLANQKLPAPFKDTAPFHVNEVIKQLLELLNNSNKGALDQLLQSAGSERLYSLIDVDLENVQIGGDADQRISGYLPGDPLVPKEETVREALRILEYFLINGVMPEYLDGADKRYRLKQLIMFLNYERRPALDDLLGKQGHLSRARMQLHNIFATAGNMAEINAGRTLRSYFEKDALLYIREITPSGVGPGQDTNLRALMAPLLADPQTHAEFVRSVLKQPAMAGYIARYYSDELAFGLLNSSSSVIGSEMQAQLRELHELFSFFLTDTLMREWFHKLFREFNLMILGGHITAKVPSAYLGAFFRFISSANYALYLKLSIALIASVKVPPPTLAPKLAEVLKELHGHKENDRAKLEVQKLLTEADQQALRQITGSQPGGKRIPEAKQLKEELAGNKQLREAVKKEKNKELLIKNEETVYITNAGLVLLNPFLSTYFVRLGMMEGGRFVSADAQLRAVLLLQYLVNGTRHCAEHELVLNKILCNLPVEEPVVPEIILSGNEIKVSEELLKAVLNAWEKLRNTSIQGFQASFLQRPGALVFRDDAWHLRVEQRSYDVLLQTLPWTIGMIKTPWMDNFLYVEWT